MDSRTGPTLLLRALALAAALAAGACSETSTTADFTSLQVLAYFDGALPLDELWVSGKLASGADAFMAGKIPVAALTTPPARRRESAVLILGPELAGLTAHVSIDGKAGGEILTSGAADVTFVLGQAVTASISLSAPSTCGDGRVTTVEACDDGNHTDGDGCSATCAVERGWVCALAPSRCSVEAETVFADPGATCPGDGSAAHPFCRLGTAAQAPRTTTVVARRGLYREAVVLDHVRLTILGEPGAVIESGEPPALHVTGGSIVSLAGLLVRGAASGGGGVTIDGADTAATLEAMEIGPSAAVGVRLEGSATLALRRTRVTGNTGGGVALDSTADYTLENDLVLENGSAESELGGIAVRRSSGRSTMVNLTVAHNRGSVERLQSLGGAGIGCAVAADVVSSIVWDNEGAAPISEERCRASYSDVGPLDGAPAHLGNFSEDPQLTADGHLGASSPCIDRGDPSGVQPAGVAPPVDYDNEPRPAGSAVDVGADEAG